MLLNQGDGTFAAAVAYGAGNAPESVAIGDLDGVNGPDLAVANRDSDDVSVLLNQGDGTFAAAVAYGAGNAPESVAIGDLDGVNGADLAVAIKFSDDVSVLLNLCTAQDDCSDFPCGNNDNKVLLCHVPPGNPENAHTLCINPNAVPAHLENHEGDHCGPCEDDDDDDGVPLALLAVESNAPGVFIDLTPMDTNEQSGGFAPFERSYELFSLISLTAPKTQQGRTFVRWDFDATFFVDADGPTLQLLVIIGYPQTVTAIYSPPQPNAGSPTRR